MVPVLQLLLQNQVIPLRAIGKSLCKIQKIVVERDFDHNFGVISTNLQGHFL